MTEDFYRIKRLPPYVFAEVNSAKAKMRAEGRDIIDLGMGNPDSPTPKHIVDKLCEVARDETAHGYSQSKGIPGLRKALCGYYDRRFGVKLDANSEVVVTIGSKEGLANLSQAITAPGDIILVPNPSYPIHPFGFMLAGASLRYIPITKDVNFIDALKRAIKHSIPKPVAVILNYPCNPTTECVGLDFYEEVVDICKHHGVYVISDLAYCEIYFDDNPPPSVLQVKGAKDIAIEFTTMSKTYSMAGWRIGFGAGNKHLVQSLTKMKSYLDYGAFTPIQVAATAALNGPQDCVEEVRKIYKERRDLLVKGLREAGWDVPSPAASMFIWAPIPEKYAHLGSLEFSKLLLKEAEVAVAPGIGFGEYGDTHVRIALVENKNRLRQAIRNIKHFLQKDDAVKKQPAKKKAAV
jgi:alanine-synthesizing transaminase